MKMTYLPANNLELPLLVLIISEVSPDVPAVVQHAVQQRPEPQQRHPQHVSAEVLDVVPLDGRQPQERQQQGEAPDVLPPEGLWMGLFSVSHHHPSA